MESTMRLARRQKLEGAAWLFVALLLATAPFWQVYILEACSVPLYGPGKGSWIRRVGMLEAGLRLFEVLAAAAAFGFAFRAISRGNFGSLVAGLFIGLFLSCAALALILNA